jgi:superfamily II DNA/RNA helicase
VKKLEKRGVEAIAMHGNLQQNKRAKALRDFKEGNIRILIATDVAARGIDIEQLPCVINYELPRSPNDYTHRIGRTGRAGEEGTAISIITHQDYQHFGVIEKRNGIRLEREQIKGFEADAKAPEAPKRSQPKKKAKSKKRKSLVDKKIATKQDKLNTEKLNTKKESAARKEKFAEKAKAQRKPNIKSSEEKESFYAKPSRVKDSTTGEARNKKSEKVLFDEIKKPKKPSGASLYTRKLPKVDD